MLERPTTKVPTSIFSAVSNIIWQALPTSMMMSAVTPAASALALADSRYSSTLCVSASRSSVASAITESICSFPPNAFAMDIE